MSQRSKIRRLRPELGLRSPVSNHDPKREVRKPATLRRRLAIRAAMLGHVAAIVALTLTTGYPPAGAYARGLHSSIGPAYHHSHRISASLSRADHPWRHSRSR